MSRRAQVVRVLKRWLILLSGGYVVLCLLVYARQRSIQYYPDSSPVPLPTGPRFAGLDEVSLVAADGTKLVAWHWPGLRPVTLVIFHGNAGNRGGGRQSWMESLHRRGWGVFLLDYRGYGGSEGSPTEEGLYADGDAAVAWLRENSSAELVFLGESLGSGVAVEMATRHPPSALIVQAGFSSAVDVGRAAFPFLPVKYLLHDRFDNADKIANVRSPYLHIHGQEDRIVPFEFGKRLYEAANEPKDLVGFSGVGHNDLIWATGSTYYDAIDRFLEAHVLSGESDRRTDPPESEGVEEEEAES